jgi:hypothetical protein
MNMIILICAAIAALGFGVLLAFTLCRAGFAALRMHARAITAQQPQPVKARIAEV